MKFTIALTKEAESDLDRLDKRIEARIREKLKDLSCDPLGPQKSKPLKMVKGVRVSRVGDWRILFEVLEAHFIVKVTAVRHRSIAYK